MVHFQIFLFSYVKLYLRLLLTHVKGATSFENLKTVKGELKRNFKQAAITYNLLESDDQLDECLNEVLYIFSLWLMKKKYK